jgi:hypothetical protein
MADSAEAVAKNYPEEHLEFGLALPGKSNTASSVKVQLS